MEREEASVEAWEEASVGAWEEAWEAASVEAWAEDEVWKIFTWSVCEVNQRRKRDACDKVLIAWKHI